MGAPEPCSDAAEHPLALGTALALGNGALGQGWVSSAVVTHPSDYKVLVGPAGWTCHFNSSLAAGIAFPGLGSACGVKARVRRAGKQAGSAGLAGRMLVGSSLSAAQCGSSTF